MIPSSTRFKSPSKTLQAKEEAITPLAVIAYRRSRTDHAIALVLCALTTLALTSSALPSLTVVLGIMWTVAVTLHRQQHPIDLIEIQDEGSHWLLIGKDNTERVRYLATDYRSSQVLIVRFLRASGGTRVLCIWRDSVDAQHFSWLSARFSLTNADTPLRTVANPYWG